MEAATRLTPESLYLEGRKDFFRGRALLFTKNYPAAADLLEQSVRIDPGAAYGYNALGISYLEQADFRKAIPAFRDAAHRAPLWSYPLHNLALAYVESGDYRGAIRSYQQAMKITPQYSYLPYNLGLVYQRTNRRKEAEQSYRLAMSLAPDSAEPLNALGSLKSQEGKTAEAEKLYRDALAKNANLLAARHNLATAARRAQRPPTGSHRAVARQPAARSRLSCLAPEPRRDARRTRRHCRRRSTEYQAVVRAKPEYVAARTALADLYVKNHDNAAAIEQLREMRQARSAKRADLRADRRPGMRRRDMRRKPRPRGSRRSIIRPTNPRANGINAKIAGAAK